MSMLLRRYHKVKTEEVKEELKEEVKKTSKKKKIMGVKTPF